MIKVNEDFEFEKDKFQWILHEWKDSESKEGEAKRVKTTTYHGSLEQVCNRIVQNSAGKCESVSEIIDVIDNAKRDILTAIKTV